MTLYVTPTRCPACRARPRVRLTALLRQMVEVCRPHGTAVVLTALCRCGSVIEVRASEVSESRQLGVSEYRHLTD